MLLIMRFPHSDTHGSLLICSSPWLFAACRVLLRLPMPRHSPCALFSLNFMRTQILTFKVFVFSHCQSFNCHLLVVVFYPMLYAYCFSRFAFSPFVFYSVFKVHLVGSSGLEPPTSRLSGARSSLLSYEPLSVISSYLRLSHYHTSASCFCFSLTLHTSAPGIIAALLPFRLLS